MGAALHDVTFDTRPPTKRRVVGLVRVSTSQQATDDRGGIPRQRRVIEQTIKNKNLDCLRVYELADVSGTDVIRNPTVIEVLQLVRSGVVTGLVVADLDRLFRPSEPTDYAILQVFKDTGAIIFSGDSEYDLRQKDSALFANIRSAISGFELALMRERQQGACEAKRRAAKCPTNHLTLPTGVSYDRKTETWGWNERAPDVVEIFRLFGSGTRSYTDIGRKFGLSNQTVRNILKNRIYTGVREITQKRGPKRVSRTGKTYRVKVDRPKEDVIVNKVLEPIVTEEAFERCQQFIAQVRFNHHESRKNSGNFNLASGIAFCGHCGERLLCSTGQRRSGKRHGQYFCKSNYYLYRDKLGGCQQPNVSQPEVDQLVEQFAVRTLRDGKTLEAIITHSLRRDSQVIHAFPSDAGNAQAAALRRKEKRLLDAYQDGIIELEELRTRREAIRHQITELERQNAKADATEDAGMEDFVRKVVRGALRLSRITDPKEKKTLIQGLFSQVFLRGDSIVSFKFQPDLHIPGSDGQAANLPIQLETPFRLREPEPSVPARHQRCSCCHEAKKDTEFYPRKCECKACISQKAKLAHQRRKAARTTAKKQC